MSSLKGRMAGTFSPGEAGKSAIVIQDSAGGFSMIVRAGFSSIVIPWSFASEALIFEAILCDRSCCVVSFVKNIVSVTIKVKLKIKIRKFLSLDVLGGTRKGKVITGASL
jgi:hypothetical protein